MSTRLGPSARAGLAVALLCVAGCAQIPPADGQLSGSSGAGAVFKIDLDDGLAGEKLDRLRSSAKPAGARIYVWLDVGRSPKLATEHPEWIAGMGSHEDWRRIHPGAPSPADRERVGVWPWTPIWYRAVLENRRGAILRLLRGRTEGIAGVFLSHVQGAPSACGCGNDQCRWTVDYRTGGGPEKLTGSPSAALLDQLKADLPGLSWIPVWCTECEEQDLADAGSTGVVSTGVVSTGHCGGVPCFTGTCWKESTRELEALLRSTDGPIGLLAGEKTFRRKVEGASWIPAAAASVEKMAIQFSRTPLTSDRLILVVEDEPVAKSLPADLRSRVAGVIVGGDLFDESWEPRIIPRVSAAKPAETPAVKPGEALHGHN